MAMSENGGNRVPEMDCAELVKVVTEYLEGTMSPVDRQRFDAHLRECPWCETYLEQMRQTIEAVGELRTDSLDPRVREEMLTMFRGWRASDSP